MQAFHCCNQSCALHTSTLNKDAARQLNHSCPVCSEKLILVTKTTLSETEQRILKDYPTLIALPFRRFHQANNPIVQSKRLQELFTNIIKYLALIGISSYFNSKEKDVQINRFLQIELQRPKHSTWLLLIDLVCKRLPSSSLFVEELPEFWKGVHTKPAKNQRILSEIGYIDEMGNYYQNKTSLSPIEGLLNYRNQQAHRSHRSDELEQQDLDVYYPVILFILKQMQWCTEYPMFKIIPQGLVRLMGTETTIDATIQTTVQQGLLLKHQDKGVLSLLPFFLSPNTMIRKSLEQSSILIFEEHLGKRILYINTKGEEFRIERPVEIWNHLLDQKYVAELLFTKELLSYENLRQRFTDIVIVEQRELKASLTLIDDTYVHRTETEKQLDYWMMSNTIACNLQDDAGAGKTTLLAHMIEKWTSEGHLALFLRGRYQENIPLEQLLQQRLRLDQDVVIQDISALLSPHQRLVIVIDAINENSHPKNMLENLSAFCKQHQHNNNIKILFSLRSDTVDLGEALTTLNDILYTPSTLDFKNEDIQTTTLKHKHVSHLTLSKMNYQELSQLWNKLSQKHPKLFSPLFSFDTLLERDRSWLNEFTSPLILKTFLMTYHGRHIPKKIQLIDLWEQKWRYSNRNTNDQGHFQKQFALFLLQEGKMYTAFDDLYKHPVLQPLLKTQDITSPLNILLYKHILVDRKTISGPEISFNIDSEHDFALAKAIIDMGWANDIDTLLSHIEPHLEYPSIFGAIRFLLHLQSQTNLDFLIEAVHELTYFEEECGQVLADRLLHLRNPNWLIDSICAKVTEQSIKIIIEASYTLSQRNAFQLCDTLLQKVCGSIDENHTISTSIKIELYQRTSFMAIQAGKLDNAIAFANRCLSMIDTSTDPSTQIDIYQHLHMSLSSIGQHQEALNWLLKCEQISQHHELSQEQIYCIFNDIGLEYVYLGNNGNAEEYFLKALSASKPDTKDSAWVENNLGLIYLNSNQLQKAEQYFLQVSNTLTRLEGPTTDSLNIVRVNLIQVSTRTGQLTKGIQQAEQLLKDMRTQGDHDPYESALVQHNIASIYQQLGRYTEALDHVHHTLTSLETSTQFHHFWFTSKLLEAELQWTLDNLTEAQQILEDVRSHPNQPLLTEVFIENLSGLLCSDTDDFAQAYRHFERGIQLLEENQIPNHTLWLILQNNLGLNLLSTDQSAAAVKHYERYVEIGITSLTTDSPYVKMLQRNLLQAYIDSDRLEDAFTISKSLWKKENEQQSPLDHLHYLQALEQMIDLGLELEHETEVLDALKTYIDRCNTEEARPEIALYYQYIDTLLVNKQLSLATTHIANIPDFIADYPKDEPLLAINHLYYQMLFHVHNQTANDQFLLYLELIEKTSDSDYMNIIDYLTIQKYGQQFLDSEMGWQQFQQQLYKTTYPLQHLFCVQTFLHNYPVELDFAIELLNQVQPESIDDTTLICLIADLAQTISDQCFELKPQPFCTELLCLSFDCCLHIDLTPDLASVFADLKDSFAKQNLTDLFLEKLTNEIDTGAFQDIDHNIFETILHDV